MFPPMMSVGLGVLIRSIPRFGAHGVSGPGGPGVKPSPWGRGTFSDTIPASLLRYLGSRAAGHGLDVGLHDGVLSLAAAH